MPRRPPSPCTAPRCPALVAGGGRCPAHRPKDDRPSYGVKNGYDRRWQRTSKAYLAGHDCCEEPGCWRTATEVDHIDGLGPLGPLGHDETNLRAYCKPHHSRKTALENGGLGRAKRRRPADGVGG